MAGAGDKTEKATPKRRDEARKKGQVAKSQDVNGAMILLVALFVLGSFAPHMAGAMADSMHRTLRLIATPQIVSARGLGSIFTENVKLFAGAVLPVAAACLVVGIVTNVAQVKWKPSLHGIKPDPKRLDPLKGAKNLFGPNLLFEGAKNVSKVAIVGAITGFAVIPKLTELAGLVGMTPQALLPKVSGEVLGIAQRAAAAYLVIGIVDYAYQRRRIEKSLKMDKQEVKEEQKQYAPPAEVRSAIRRRQMQAAKARMMAAVPEADVVVTNPTHYAVALVYDGTKLAPEVVAKGKDLVAAQIRRIASEHEVPVISDPPLARSLHAGVEVGHPIPEELFAAVAQLLAFVYRVAGRSIA
ncbi:MAG: flagellar biosynthesis protein FlhB [Thermoleophilaceae bacterium]